VSRLSPSPRIVMTTAPENCRINYIELNVRNIDQAKAFYGQAFGWTFTDYGPEYAEFSDGAMKGGFTTLAPPWSSSTPTSSKPRGPACWQPAEPSAARFFRFRAGGASTSGMSMVMSWGSGPKTRSCVKLASSPLSTGASSYIFNSKCRHCGPDPQSMVAYPRLA
jgi:catechol 2,3-dioxygenase-like lactoylglutathione lyase family enzyme